MSFEKKCKTSFKTWLEYNGKPLLGEGGAMILKHVQQRGSLSKAAQELGMSYRYVWGYIRNMERILGGKVLETFKGGKAGGGGARLTRLGICTLKEYESLACRLSKVLSDTTYFKEIESKANARNQFKGMVTHVEKDNIAAKVKVKIRIPATVTALISRQALEDLDIKVGDEVEAIVKTTEVMIAKQSR